MITMEFVDIHNHLAWDVDDGIGNKEECIAVLEQASKENIKTIVASPHIIPGTTYKEELERINNRINELQILASDYGIKIIPGGELFLNHNYLDLLDSNIYNTIGDSDYILVEFDVRKELGKESDVEERLYEISIRKHQIVLAHVERYFHDNIDIERVRNLFNEGIVIQVNKSSILGLHGKTTQKNAFKLIDEGLCHIIASDTHSVKGRDILMSKAYQEIVNKYNEDIARKLFYVNPLHVINNEDVEDIEVIKKSLFSSLFKRR